MTSHMESDKIGNVELNKLHNVPNPLKRKDIVEDFDSREKRWCHLEEKQRRDMSIEQGVKHELKQGLHQERDSHQIPAMHQNHDVYIEQDPDMHQVQHVHPEQEMNQVHNVNLEHDLNQVQDVNIAQNLNQVQDFNLKQDIDLEQDVHLEHNINKEQEGYLKQKPAGTSKVNFELFNKTEKALCDQSFISLPNPKLGSTQTLISKSEHSIYVCEGDCSFIIPVSINLTAEDSAFLKRVREQIEYRTLDKAHREQAVFTASQRFNFEQFYKITKESQQFNCNFYINHFLVSSVKAPTEERARSKSVNVGIDNLQKCLKNPLKQKKLSKKKNNQQYVHLEQEQKQDVNMEQELRLRTTELIPGVVCNGKTVNTTELETFNKEDSKCKFLANSFPQRFVLIYHSEQQGTTPEKILNDSAEFSNLKLIFKCERKVKRIKQRICSAILDGEVCGTGVYGNKKGAKDEAAKAALEFLKTFIYSIKVKKIQSHDNEIKRDQLRGSSIAKPISDDNIGAKMMKMMGWSGGSIGKVGSSGITEPILCDNTQMHREGLGFSSDKKNSQTFNATAYNLIRNYAYSDTLNELIFSDEYTVDERMTILGIAKQLSLITDGSGKKDKSNIVISRKCDVETLLNHLKQVGGSTSKYELISPSPTVDVVEHTK